MRAPLRNILQLTFTLGCCTICEASGRRSFNEAEFIANDILGIPTSLTWMDCSKKELELKQNDLVYDITQLITGNVGFDYISRAWANGDALESLNIAIFFDLFIYLVEEGII